MKRWLSLLMAALMLLTTLSACGGGGEEEETQDASVLRLRATSAQKDLDPVVARANGGDMLTYHLFENLMRWEDDGTGHAKLGYGMAESYEFEENLDGSVTYTFTIRKDVKWSDGKKVTAEDFLYAWQRLFQMEEPPEDIRKLYMVEGYSQAREAKDGKLLTGVSAPNKNTLVIALSSHCAYFLDEFCAGTLTMPVREDVIDDHGAAWGMAAEHVVGNGPYRLKAMEENRIVMVRNEQYWQSNAEGPDELYFTWQGSAFYDYEKLQAGEIDFLTRLPNAVIEEAAQAGTLQIEPVASTYALLMNNMADPFDNEFVRQAFALLLDQQEIVDRLGMTTAHAATGFVPHGISNRDNEWAVEENETIVMGEEEVILPEDLIENAGQEEEPEEIFWDYRAVGDYGLIEDEMSAEIRIARAKLLMSQGGYPNGEGFPVVEYLFVGTPENRAVAEYLQQLFRSHLNVELVFKAVSEEEARALLLNGEFTMAAFRFDAAFDDALAFLQRWQSSTGVAGGNLVGFASRPYDLLLSVVSASNDSAREACLHDAEELLLESKGVIPLFYYGATPRLAEGLTGLYRHAAQDAYFFGGVRAVATETETTAQT